MTDALSGLPSSDRAMRSTKIQMVHYRQASFDGRKFAQVQESAERAPVAGGGGRDAASAVRRRRGPPKQ